MVDEISWYLASLRQSSNSPYPVWISRKKSTARNKRTMSAEIILRIWLTKYYKEENRYLRWSCWSETIWNRHHDYVKEWLATKMTTPWHGNVFLVIGPLWGEFASRRWASNTGVDILFDVSLNEQLNAQSLCRFETQWHSAGVVWDHNDAGIEVTDLLDI